MSRLAHKNRSVAGYGAATGKRKDDREEYRCDAVSKDGTRCGRAIDDSFGTKRAGNQPYFCWYHLRRVSAGESVECHPDSFFMTSEGTTEDGEAE